MGHNPSPLTTALSNIIRNLNIFIYLQKLFHENLKIEIISN